MKNLLLLLLLLPALYLSAQEVHRLDIYFEKNSTELNEDSKDQLDAFFKNSPKRIAELSLEIFPLVTNQEERAGEITDYIKYFDKKVNKIVYFKKEEHLYFEQENIQNWNFLRLVYRYKSKELAKGNKRLPKINQSVKISEYETNTLLNEQQYTLFLDKGCILHIPQKAFVDAEGNLVKGDVLLRTREIMDGTDALLAGVTTNLPTGFLESRGMIEILGETPEGEPLQLAEGKSIQIEFPVKERQSTSTDETPIVNTPPNSDEFQIYKGQLNDRVYDWLLDTATIEKTSRPYHKRFTWQKIPDEQLDSMRQVRKEIILEWKDKGRSNIKSRLKRYHESVKKRNRYYHKRDKGERITRYNRNYERITKSMILGRARFRWNHDPIPNNSNSMVQYYSFRAFTLGMWNIDRLYNSRKELKDLLASADESLEIRVLFKEVFVLIDGKRSGSETVFRQIPIEEELLFIATERLPDGKIRLGSQTGVSGGPKQEITATEVYTEKEYKLAVKDLVADFQQ